MDFKLRNLAIYKYITVKELQRTPLSGRSMYGSLIFRNSK